jgi:hypothetical protein
MRLVNSVALAQAQLAPADINWGEYYIGIVVGVVLLLAIVGYIVVEYRRGK